MCLGWVRVRVREGKCISQEIWLNICSKSNAELGLVKTEAFFNLAGSLYCAGKHNGEVKDYTDESED